MPPRRLSDRAAADAARLLLAARHAHTAADGLPAHCAPATLDDAYAVQAAFTRLRGARLAGYKVGCASLESQRFVGTRGPFSAHVHVQDCHRSPAALAASSWFAPGVEAEFSFRLGDDLPAEGAPWSRAGVAAAVAEVVPSIEICDTRLADWRAAGALQVVADNGFHGALVLGDGIADWHGIDLAAHEVRLLIDGIECGRGTGALVLGHPLDSLAWLANDLAARGQGLVRGQIVAAGTCTGLHPVRAACAVAAEFGTLGSVRLDVGA